MFEWSTIVAIVQPKNYFILVAGMNLKEEKHPISSSHSN